VTIDRTHQWHPQKFANVINSGAYGAAKVKTLDWVLLTDPQDCNRQGSLDLGAAVGSLNHSPSYMWQWRNYRLFPDQRQWNPYGFPLIGPQWGALFPAGDADIPGLEFENIEWFYGFMQGSGKKVDYWPFDRGWLPYSFVLTDDLPWKWVEPNSFKAQSWVMKVNEIAWQHRLVQYLVQFARWADGQLPDDWQGFLLGPTKHHQYWHPDERRRRLLEPRPAPGMPNAGKPAPILWWMGHDDWKPTREDLKTIPGSHHVAYADTNSWDHLTAYCRILRLLHHKLHQAGINFSVSLDLEKVWIGSNWSSILVYAGTNEQAAIGHIWQNMVEAASYCDSILWPSHSQNEIRHINNEKPWVWDMMEEMKNRTLLVTEVAP